jgi:hypothetical protein
MAAALFVLLNVYLFGLGREKPASRKLEKS